MAEHWMEILRPGEWNGYDYTPDFIRELQASYDPEVREAPIVIGHPDPFGDERPAYGWVKALEIRKWADAETDDDISLWAFTDFSEEAENMIRERKFPKRSIGWSSTKPFNGIPYLGHVALLGASNPAVDSLEDVKMKAEAELEAIRKKFEKDSFTDVDGVLVTLSVNDKMIELIWESKETEYWYRVRPPNRFRDNTMKSFDFEGVAGLRAVAGKLKPQFVPEGGKPDSLVIQALRFDKKEFDLSKAKAWVASHKKELSNMSEGTITLTADEEMVKLKAENAKLEAKMKKTAEDAEAEKAKALKAEAELETIRLAAREGEFEHELKALIDDGNGVPAYIELGVHKALVAVDSVDVVLSDGKTVKASEIFMMVLKAMPKVLETAGVAGKTKIDDVKLSEGIPTDNRFATAMTGYQAEGKKVVNLEFVELMDKIAKEEKLSPKDAAIKALTLARQGGS